MSWVCIKDYACDVHIGAQRDPMCLWVIVEKKRRDNDSEDWSEVEKTRKAESISDTKNNLAEVREKSLSRSSKNSFGQGRLQITLIKIDWN